MNLGKLKHALNIYILDSLSHSDFHSQFKCRIKCSPHGCLPFHLDRFVCFHFPCCNTIHLERELLMYWNWLRVQTTDISVVLLLFGLLALCTERAESTRFPGQHMFDHQGPLMNSSNNLHQQQQLPGQGHMGFGPPGPAFNQPGQGPLGLFPREPPRPNLPPHQGHQGMVGLNQQSGPPNQPRPFMGPRQPFGQQGNLFPPPQVQFGMQVRLRVSDFFELIGVVCDGLFVE